LPLRKEKIMLDETLDELLNDPEEQLNIRIAWYYYVTEMTQQQIADRLGITRVRVNKALSICRQSGVVQIRINSKLASCIRLEYALENHYNLSKVIVVPTPENDQFIFRSIGVGTSPYIHDQVYDGCSFAVGWGRTLRHTILETRGRHLPSMTIVSLMGGLNYRSGYNTFEIAASFGRLFDASHHFPPAPFYADSEEARDAILGQPSVQHVFDKARNADLALVGAGDVIKHSLGLELGLINLDDVKSLEAAGVVGELLGHYLNKDGEELDHSVNRRVISVDLDDLARIKKVILVAGGLYKVNIIRAVLLRKLVHVLVTDEATAQQLVSSAPQK
jgi:DNA-binding transcriptional regulator LsrR (DeoR family)